MCGLEPEKCEADGEGCPALTMSRWELMSLVWCSALFLAAWKSQLLITRPAVEEEILELGKCDNVSKSGDPEVRDAGFKILGSTY